MHAALDTAGLATITNSRITRLAMKIVISPGHSRRGGPRAKVAIVEDEEEYQRFQITWTRNLPVQSFFAFIFEVQDHLSSTDIDEIELEKCQQIVAIKNLLFTYKYR